MDNVIDINEFKAIEKIIKDRLGDKFVIAYMDGTNCSTYISEGVTDMELCYMADTLNDRRN